MDDAEPSKCRQRQRPARSRWRVCSALPGIVGGHAICVLLLSLPMVYGGITKYVLALHGFGYLHRYQEI
jgi:hypothetical protein